MKDSLPIIRELAILTNDFCDQIRAVSRAHRLAFKAKSMPPSASLNAYVLLKQFRTNFFHKNQRISIFFEC
jgi:hypothetical protein